MKETLDTGTPMDMEAMTSGLKERNLGGMPAPMKLFMVEQGIETYEELLSALRSPEFRNEVGNMQFDATDIDRARAIMGTGTDGERPKNYGVCIAKEVLDVTIQALEQILEEERKRRLQEMGNETYAQANACMNAPAESTGVS